MNKTRRQVEKFRRRFIAIFLRLNSDRYKSVAKCRGSWVAGRGRGSWVWV